MKPLSRRTFLRGAGACIGLPLLEAMWPASARAASAPPRRFLAFYVPNGIHMPAFTPSALGTAFDLPPILQPLAPHRDHLTVVSGLENRAGFAGPDGSGDHARGTGTFLTCTRLAKTSGDGIRNGVSVDQVIAGAVGGGTLVSSLVLGLEGGGPTGSCDSGYSCAYSRNISWAGESTPAAKLTNPRDVFQHLFGSAEPDRTPEELARRRLYRKSVLDLVRADAQALSRRVGAADRRKLDEYLTGVRELEVRIEAEASAPVCTTGTRPDHSDDVRTRLDQMMDLMVTALACDSTRVVTFMLANAGTGRTHPWIGVNRGHHEISHHGGDPANHADLVKIATWEVEQLAELLRRMKAVQEGDGTLLDSTLVFFSSEIEDGDRHAHTNLPVLVAGRSPAVPGGRHLRVPGGTPKANLFVTLQRECGAGDAPFADSTGALSLA